MFLVNFLHKTNDKKEKRETKTMLNQRAAIKMSILNGAETKESNAGYNGGKVESGLFIINAKPSLEIASAHLNNMSNLEINLLRILMFEAKSNILKIKKTKKIQNKIKSGFLFCFAF